MNTEWDIARKLINLSDKERQELFDETNILTLIDKPPIYIKNIIEKYEEELERKRIHVGDIVTDKDGFHQGIVTYASYNDNCEEVYDVVFSVGWVRAKLKKEELVKVGLSNNNIINLLKDIIFPKKGD